MVRRKAGSQPSALGLADPAEAASSSGRRVGSGEQRRGGGQRGVAGSRLLLARSVPA